MKAITFYHYRNAVFFMILLICAALCSHAQTQQQRQFGIAEVFRSGDSIFIKKLVTQVINVSEGTVTKMRTPPDTAKLFISPDGGIYEGVVTWRKVGGVVVPVTEKIDGELANFTGAWVRTSTNPGWYQNSIAFSNTPNSTVSYTFTGTKIALWSERLATHGTGTVSIDNGTPVAVSFKVAPFGLPVKIWESAVLPSGSHTIKLTCVSGYVLLDYFQVIK